MTDAQSEISALRARVAELETVLREVQYCPHLEREYYGDSGTWVYRCVGCGQVRGVDCDPDCKAHAALKGGHDATRGG